MPSIISATVGSTTVGANYLKNTISTSDAGRTLIVSVSKTGGITDANLNSIINNYITLSHGVSGSGDSAFTVAGVGTADGSAFVAGSTETVYLRLQGTGALTVADADLGISGYAVAVVCVFQPAL